jgi:hypothetical protein
LLAAQAVCRSLPQSKELEIYYRPSTYHSGLKLWIEELGCYVQRFPQLLHGRLIASGGCVGLPEGGEKVHPISANICLKVSETSPSRFGCFLEATSPDKGIGQLDKAPPDHLPITEIDVKFERFTQIDKCRVPSFETSLSNRNARQQISPFS